jgi:8-oxo-dGTP pyrophosphatase MutT (NUDIX family)
VVRVGRMEQRTRPTARVVCLDAADRVLLLRWRDPADGTFLWEPPGGGIEAGETAFDAARRELVEETGLDPGAVGEYGVTVRRDVRWKGVRFVGPEEYFLARFAADRPEVRGTGLTEGERHDLQEYAWVPVTAFDLLDDPLQPPELADVVRMLNAGQDPGGQRQSGA